MGFQVSMVGAAACLAATIPGPAEVEQLDRRVALPAEPVTGEPAVLAPVVPPIRAPAGSDKIRFELTELKLDGVTAYPEEELEPIFADHIGQEISVQKLFEIAEAIAKRYHDDGYGLSRVIVPAQAIEDGVVRLQVVEGYVAAIHIKDRYRNFVTKEFIARVESMRPLHVPTLEHLLLLLNDQAGIRATATLIPMSVGAAVPGAVAMQLAVDRAPVGGQLSIGNSGSRYVGPWEGTASVWASDEFLPFDQLSVRTNGTTRNPELRYGEVQYHAPLNATGTSAGITVSRARTQPGFTLRALNIMSEARTVRGEVSQTLARTREETLTATAGLEHKDVGTDIIGSSLYRDRLTVATARLSGSAADRWAGVNSIDVNLRQGLDTLGARKTGSPAMSRAYGHSQFTVLNGTATRLQSLFGTWQANLALNGQFASSPLLASEQFGFGGGVFGRAYDPSELTGDQGLAGALELRYNGFSFPSLRLGVMPFAYYDLGKVWNISPGGQAFSAASVGGGLVLKQDLGWQLSITAAKPLTRRQDNPLTGNRKSPRWLAQLSYAF